MRGRWVLLAGSVVIVGAVAAARSTARAVERRVARAVQERGGPHGLSVRTVRFSWIGPLRLEGVTIASAGPARATIDEARVAWGLAGGREERAHLRHVALRGLRVQRGDVVAEWPAADLEIASWRAGPSDEHIRLRQAGSGGEIDARWRKAGAGQALVVSLSAFDLAGARVSWHAEPVLAPGSWTGRLSVAQEGDHLATEGAVSANGVRICLPRGLASGNAEYGAPTSATLSWGASRDPASLDVRRLTARVGELELDGHGRFTSGGEDRTVEMAVSARSDLGAALQTTALHLPASVPIGPTDRLGVASLEVAVRGPLARPADLSIVPHLSYESTPAVAEKLQFLRRPFRYRPAEGSGVVLDVRDGAPDFVPLAQVPPLFLRALLISEDAGFYGHPGIDVAEIPVAWATNLERGTAARGASTITQQLVKNLFLSKDKSYARKLEEAALALLVDAAVPKARLLEIYVNVIEWGPNLFGLVPAARHYFGKGAGELTPREMAFLVCLIPNPVRYHQSHLAGHVGPGMDQLMANLLAKLRSVDAITEEELAQALAEELRFRPEDGG